MWASDVIRVLSIERLILTGASIDKILVKVNLLLLPQATAGGVPIVLDLAGDIYGGILVRETIPNEGSLCAVQRCQRTVQFEAYHRNVQRFFGVGPYVRTCMATRTKLRTYSFWIGKVR